MATPIRLNHRQRSMYPLIIGTPLTQGWRDRLLKTLGLHLDSAKVDLRHVRHDLKLSRDTQTKALNDYQLDRLTEVAARIAILIETIEGVNQLLDDGGDPQLDTREIDLAEITVLFGLRQIVITVGGAA